MSNNILNSVADKESGLQKQLTTAQLGMIAIGGAIGTGLFLGSGFAISLAGPSVIISYAIGGIIALLMMTALSEMAVAQPTAGSFGVYAEEYVNPWAGFAVRYSYWVGLVIGVGTEVTATGIYMQYWFPHIPSVIWIVLFAVILFIVNSTSVGNFGKFEFWFASIKVAAIVAFIITGCILIFGPFGKDAGFTFENYTNDRGFAPFGISGIMLGSFIAIFSYLSMEMIAVTAGEAKDPEKAIPKALKSAMVRLLLFYIVSIGLMLAMIPWAKAGTTQSPFVTAFSLIGFPYAAGIMNFVVLTAALSSLNSMMYVTGRMMFSLSRGGYAPKAFGQLTKKGVPLNALIISCAGVLIAVIVNRVLPQDSQFISMMGMSMFGPLFTWMMILITHLYFRPKWKAAGGRELPIKMPLFPYLNWFAIILMGTVVLYSCLTMFRTTLAMGIPWFILISLVYFIWFSKKKKNEE